MPMPQQTDYYRPLIVQSDMTILLETDNESYESARNELAIFAEAVKSPEYIHTYKITPLSLWNAASAGVSSEAVIDTLSRFSKGGIYLAPLKIHHQHSSNPQQYQTA